MKFPVKSAVWQHPFVDILKQYPDMQVEKQVEGDVEELIDKVIHKMVYRIKGSVSASNYVQIPKEGTAPPQGLGLTGRYVYIQMRDIPKKMCAIHLEFCTEEKNTLRVSLGSSYTSVQSTGSALQVPLRPRGKWSVVALDMVELLKLHTNNCYNRQTFGYIKAIQLCSNMIFRGIYTSDTAYDPESLPSAMELPIPREQKKRGQETQPILSWHSCFSWEWIPHGDPSTKDESFVHSNERRGVAMKSTRAKSIGEKRHYAPSSVLSQTLNLDEMYATENSIALDSSTSASINQATLVSHLSHVVADHGKAMGTMKPVQGTRKKRTGNGSVPSRMHPLEQDKKSIRSQADPGMKEAGLFSYPSKASVNGNLLNTPTPSNSGLRGPTDPIDATWPDPILSLERLVGYSGQFSHCLLWTSDGTSCVFASMSTIVIIDFDDPDASAPSSPTTNAVQSPYKLLSSREKNESTNNPLELNLTRSKAGRIVEDSSGSGSGSGDVGGGRGRGSSNTQSSKHATEKNLSQRFLFGHTSAVCNIAFNYDSTLLASGQEGRNPIVRMWDFTTGNCVAIIKAHNSGLSHLCFSTTTSLFCAVGLDEHFRAQVIIWDISQVMKGRVQVIAKQMCEFPITRINFSPYETNRLVSCGRENIRFWRIKKGHLPGCPVVLNEYARNSHFTDLAFDKLYGTHPAGVPHQRPVYISSAIGTVLLVDCDTMELQCVYKLHDGPINCLSVNEGFCVTGSNDRFLRVWPLDFTDYFLEAQHEAEVTSIDVSTDGLRILIGTKNGAVGVLDVSSQEYSTVMRSHTQGIKAVSIDPCRPECSTASTDGTIRVWDVMSGLQVYEFVIQQDAATCIAYHPAEHVIAVGFASGCTRIFDIPTASVTEEYQQHRGEVSGVEYSGDGATLFTYGTDSQVCVYDVGKGYQPVKMTATDFHGNTSSFRLSPNGTFIAALSEEGTKIVLLSTASMKVVRKLEYRRKAMGATGLNTSAFPFTKFIFGMDSKEILALTESQRLIWFRTSTGEVIRSVAFPGPTIDYLGLSPNGRYLVTGDSESSIKVWDYYKVGESHRKFQSFIGHCGNISFIGFSGNSERIISAGTGNAIHIWHFLGDKSDRQVFSDTTASMVALSDTLSPIGTGGNLSFFGNGSVERHDDDEDIDPNTSVPRPHGPPHLLTHSGKPQPKESVIPVTSSLPSSTKTKASFRFSRVSGFNLANNIHCFLWDSIHGVLVYAVDSNIVVDNLDPQEQVLLPSVHTSAIRLLTSSARKSLFASIETNDDVLAVWHIHGALKCTISLPAKRGAASAVAFSWDEKYLLVAGGDHVRNEDDLATSSNPCTAYVLIVDLTMEKIVHEQSFEAAGQITCICCLPAKAFRSEARDTPQLGFMCLPSGKKNAVDIWEWFDTELRCKTMGLITDSDKTNTSFVSASQYIADIGVSGSVLCASDSGDVWIYDLEKQGVLFEWNYAALLKRSLVVNMVQFITNRCMKALLIMVDTNEILRFDLPLSDDQVGGINWTTMASEGLTLQIIELCGTVTSMSWEDRDAEGVLTTSEGGIWHLNLVDGCRTRFANNHVKKIADFDCLLDGSLIATAGGEDGSVRIWHAETLQQVVQFQVTNLSCACVCLNKGGMEVGCAAGYSDGSVRLYSLDKMRLLYRCFPFGEENTDLVITRLRFIADGRVLVCGNSSGNLVLLDLLHVPNDRDVVEADVHFKSFVAGTQLPQAIQVYELKVSPFTPDIFVALSETNTSCNLIVCCGNSSSGKQAVIFDAFVVPKPQHDPNWLTHAVFSPQNDNIIIYLHPGADNMSHYIDFRCCRTRDIQKRVAVDILPRSLQLCSVLDCPALFYIGKHPSNNSCWTYNFFDLSKDEVITTAEESIEENRLLHSEFTKVIMTPKNIYGIHGNSLLVWKTAFVDGEDA